MKDQEAVGFQGTDSSDPAQPHKLAYKLLPEFENFEFG